MVELAEIFRQHGSSYRQKYSEHILPSHQQAIRAIEQCRTEALGGHIYQCPDCGAEQYSYHSCRNRHCPKCQNHAAQEWLEKQSDLLLPTTYFLLTFTLPEGLRRFARSNQKLFYNLLFRVSAAATQKLAQDPRFIGGQVGMVGVLHTWGRTLTYHPHVHYLVPAGGVDQDGNWLAARKTFLLPVKALSKIFRAKFRQALQKSSCYEEIPAQVWQQPWVVHCKAVGDGGSALKYLAPYIFRVAISNQRIVKMSNTHVTFRYRSTKTGKTKTCTVSAEEFIRRFLQHVLPKGFVKVRYYGFLSPGLRNRLTTLHTQLERWQPDQPSSTGGDPQTIYQPVDHPVCPACGQVMQKMKTIPTYEHKPP
jgi:predicted RNA-binding Zn-ribbon protein involved in translation (DUF1610 family)